MDDTLIVTVFVILDTLMEHFEHRSHVLAHVPDSEIVTVAVIAAHSFGNHHERALQVLSKCGYLSGSISVSRFNRRLHALADWLGLVAETLGSLAREGEVFVIDSMPRPVRRPVRARRGRQAR